MALTGTLILKYPLLFVIVPILVPFIETDTPGMPEVPPSSITLPIISYPFFMCLALLI